MNMREDFEAAVLDVGILASFERNADGEYKQAFMQYLEGIWNCALASQAQQPSTELKEMEARKDAAYLERNQVVAALTKCFPSGTTKTAIEGWSEDWHSCVYIDLPTGQASWHYHDSQAYLFADLPAYTGKWDGHTTEEKYSRIAKLQSQAQQEIEIDMLTGDVTWKFNEAQTQEPLEIQALTTICKLLDGSQPKDPLGALFVAQSALRQSQAQHTEQEPYAYDVPTDDGTELAYAIYFTKYNNPLPEGAIPLYLQSQAQQSPKMQFLDRSKEKIITLFWQGICDGTVEAFDVNGMMVIPSEEGMTYVRKEDAISFFGLVEPSQAQQESQWMPIEAAPKNTKIIVRYKNIYGKDRTVFAKYIEKFTEEAATEYETDYCESDDTYYLKEGWVELIDNWDEFSSVYFDSQNVPTHWMPLPPAPEGE